MPKIRAISPHTVTATTAQARRRSPRNAQKRTRAILVARRCSTLAWRLRPVEAVRAVDRVRVDRRRVRPGPVAAAQARPSVRILERSARAVRTWSASRIRFRRGPARRRQAVARRPQGRSRARAGEHAALARAGGRAGLRPGRVRRARPRTTARSCSRTRTTCSRSATAPPPGASGRRRLAALREVAPELPTLRRGAGAARRTRPASALHVDLKGHGYEDAVADGDPPARPRRTYGGELLPRRRACCAWPRSSRRSRAASRTRSTGAASRSAGCSRRSRRPPLVGLRAGAAAADRRACSTGRAPRRRCSTTRSSRRPRSSAPTRRGGGVRLDGRRRGRCSTGGRRRGRRRDHERPSIFRHG